MAINLIKFSIVNHFSLVTCAATPNSFKKYIFFQHNWPARKFLLCIVYSVSSRISMWCIQVLKLTANDINNRKFRLVNITKSAEQKKIKRITEKNRRWWKVNRTTMKWEKNIAEKHCGGNRAKTNFESKNKNKSNA